MSHRVNRRDFLATTGTAALGAVVLPRHLVGGVGAPSSTLNVACVGIGGMGMSNMARLLSENIVAVCDVDFPFVERSLQGRLRPRDGVVPAEALRIQEAYTRAAKYEDFRVMLERQRDIDAVLIATPDHTHAVIAQAAMELGKHVYVQKPLTWSVYEARLLARTAASTGVVTQMGNQGHSMEGTRRVVELVRSGILGPIREVHIWTDRPVRYWAQGIPRPPVEAPAPAAQNPANPPRWNMGTVERAVLQAMAENPQSPPPGLNWDLFLGPAAEIPYHPAYHPFSWRGWVDFGGGALGDMGAHLVDQAFWALELSQPTAITTSSSPWGGAADNPATFPLAVTVEYEFPARGASPPVRLFWYDGGLMPPRPPFLPDEVALPRGDGGGGVLVGERGILTYETYGNRPTIYPAAVAAEAEMVPRTVPRVEGNHEMNWVAACKGEAEVSCPFSYAAPLTESMLLGMAALRAGAGKKVFYDSAEMRFTNDDRANAALTRAYRKGWEI
jgi:predicted dehydrogenase